MKKLLTFLFVFTASLLSAAPYKVRVCQVEAIRDNAYYPDVSQFAGVTFVDGCPLLHKSKTSASSHATDVTRILLTGPSAGLVNSILVCELFEFVGPARPLDSTIDQNPYGLNGGRTLDPAASAWDVENISAGGTTQVWDDSAIAQEVKRIERDNILAFGGLPDPGMPAYALMAATKSRNFVRVGSAVSGQVTNALLSYDSLGPVWSTSYSTPTEAETGIAMVSYLKTNGIAYNAGDLGDIFRAVFKAEGKHDHDACMKALYAAYPAIGLPVTAQTSVTAPTPSPVPVSPISAPPKITTFTASNAWSQPSTPTVITWAGTGATATLTDPAGVTRTEPAVGSITITTLSSGYNWTLSEIAADGTRTSSSITLHGQFGSLIAPMPVPTPSPLPTLSPTPSPDDLRAAAAKSVGASYDSSSKTFQVPASEVQALSTALAAAGVTN